MLHCTRVKVRRLNLGIYRDIRLLSVIEKIYVRILVDRVRRLTDDLIDDE